MTRRAAALGAVLAVLWLLMPTAASAHAELISTDPPDGASLSTAPERVTLTFSEQVRAVPDGMQLLVAGQDPVPLRASALDGRVDVVLPKLSEDARYIVAWRVVSADGHPINGMLSFVVGSPAASDDPAGPTELAGVRGIDEAVAGATVVWYAGLLFLAGAAVIGWRCLPARARPGRRLALAAAVSAVVGSVLLVWFQAIRIAGRVDLGAGQILQAAGSRQIAAAVVTMLGASLAYQLLWRFSRPAAAVVPAAAAAAMPVLTGHSAAEGPTWLMISGDLVHLAAGSVWFGGLTMLVLHLRAARAAEDEPSAATIAATSGFSVLAAGSLAALAVSGTAMAVVIMPDPAALTQTRYGRILLLKVCLVLVPVAMATWNHTSLSRRLSQRPSAERWAAWRRIWRREASMLALVVAVTGVLVTQSPSQHDAHGAAPAEAGPVDLTESSGDVTVRLRAEPARSGRTAVRITVVDSEGTPVDLLKPPTVDLSLPDQAIGPSRYETQNAGGGRFTADLPTPVPGRWQIVIGVRVSEFEQRSVLLEADLG